MGAQATLRHVCKREAVARREPENIRHTPNGAAGDGANSASKLERGDDTNGRTTVPPTSLLLQLYAQGEPTNSLVCEVDFRGRN